MADIFNLSDVFISYSRKDSEFVRRLDDEFKKHDQEVWVDWEDIPLSVDWWEEIKSGIEGADTFVFVITPDSVMSEVCYKEIQHAIDSNKRFVPVLHRAVDEPEYREKIHPAISAHNWLFFREEDDFDRAFKGLLSTLKTDPDHVRMHTRLLVRAKEWNTRQRDSGYLLTTAEVREAESWLAVSGNKEPHATELHTEYILASQKAQTRRQRTLLIGVSAALAVAIALSVLSFFLYRDSQDNLTIAQARGTEAALQAQIAEENAGTAVAAEQVARNEADEARSLFLAVSAEQALENDNDPDLAISLIAEAARLNPGSGIIGNTLYRITHAAGTVLLLDGEHVNPINVVGYSPDGQIIVSGSDDTTAVLWNAQTGEMLRRLEGHASGVRSAVFSPDGAYLVSGDTDGVVIVWDVETGAVVQENDDHTGAIVALGFQADGTILMSASTDAWLRAWDIETGETISSQDTGKPLQDVILNPDGTALVRLPPPPDRDEVEANGDIVELIDVTTGETIRHMQLFDPGDSTPSVMNTATSISRDGRLVASGLSLGGSGNQLLFRDLETGEIITDEAGLPYNIMVLDDDDLPLVETSHEASSNITGIAFSPQNHVVTAGSDNSIVLQNGRKYFGHTEDINTIAFSPDGRFVVSGSDDATVRVWDVGIDIIQGFPARSSAIIFPDNSQMILWHTVRDARDIRSGESASMMSLWDATSGEKLNEFEDLPGMALRNVALSPDGMYTLSTGENSDSMIMHEVATGAIVQQFATEQMANAREEETNYVGGGVFHPDGSTAYTFSCTGQATFNREDEAETLCIETVVQGWDVAPGSTTFGEEVLRTVLDVNLQILAVSYDGQSLLYNGCIGYEDQQFAPADCMGTVFGFIDTQTGEVIRQRDYLGARSRFQGYEVRFLPETIDPDGQYLLLDTADGLVRQLDSQTGAQITTWSAWDFSPDGNFLLTSRTGDEYSTLLVDAQTGATLRQFRGRLEMNMSANSIFPDISMFAFSPDSSLVFVDGALHRLRPYDTMIGFLNDNRYLRPFTCDERLSYDIGPFCDEDGESQ